MNLFLFPIWITARGFRILLLYNHINHIVIITTVALVSWLQSHPIQCKWDWSPLLWEELSNNWTITPYDYRQNRRQKIISHWHYKSFTIFLSIFYLLSNFMWLVLLGTAFIVAKECFPWIAISTKLTRQNIKYLYFDV